MNDPSADYPKPIIPLAPVFSTSTLTSRSSEESLTGILRVREKIHLTSGRAALALALEHAGVGQEHEVLIPAYHCESMVAPVKWRGAKPVFFKIHADASIDLADIENKITSATRIIIVAHYFGFPQDLAPVLALCEKHGLRLVEDCAHAYFGTASGHDLGTQGDYAIASSMKFFAIYDGGLLASDKHSLDSVQVEAPPLLFELKSLFSMVETSVDYGRLGLPGKMLSALLALKNGVWSGLKSVSRGSNEGSTGPSSSDGGYSLDERWIRTEASFSSRYVIKRSDIERINSKRRANYQRLNAALGSLPGCRAMFPELPDTVTPLVYPLYVANAAPIFDALKKQAIPIWRFGEFLDKSVDATLCANSIDFSDHIFQFPCHQELTDDEISDLISAVSETATANL